MIKKTNKTTSKTDASIDNTINKAKPPTKIKKGTKKVKVKDPNHVDIQQLSKSDLTRIANRNSVRKFRYREKIMIEELQCSVAKLVSEINAKRNENDAMRRAIKEVNHVLSLTNPTVAAATTCTRTVAPTTSTNTADTSIATHFATTSGTTNVPAVTVNSSHSSTCSDGSSISSKQDSISRTSPSQLVDFLPPSTSPVSPSSSSSPSPVTQQQQQQTFGQHNALVPVPTMLSAESIMRLQQQLLLTPVHLQAQVQTQQQPEQQHQQQAFVSPMTVQDRFQLPMFQPPQQQQHKPQSQAQQQPQQQPQQQQQAHFMMNNPLNNGGFFGSYPSVHTHHQNQSPTQPNQLEIPDEFISSFVAQQQQEQLLYQQRQLQQALLQQQAQERLKDNYNKALAIHASASANAK